MAAQVRKGRRNAAVAVPVPAPPPPLPPAAGPDGAPAVAPVNIRPRYVGGMGEHVVMAELLGRGFNVSRAIVDEGIDVIAFKPTNPQKLFRLQVKSAFPGAGGGAATQKYTFTLSRAAYENAAGQDYYLILVMRDVKHETFVTFVIPKAIFDDYIDNQDVIDWNEEKKSWQIAVHLHDDGKLTLKNAGGTEVTMQTKNRWNRVA